MPVSSSAHMTKTMASIAGALMLLMISLGTMASPTSMDTCTRCHDETEDYPVLSILQTPHAAVADERTGFAELGCAACHGSLEEHLGDEDKPPEYTYGGQDDHQTPVSKQNEGCLNCHQGDFHLNDWEGSNHEFGDVACSSCHQIHTSQDKVRDRISQYQVCVSCHQQQAHEMRRPSRHPVPDGTMSCTDCHQPHGSGAFVADLKEPNLNETCYSCHAGKRGPVLWEHLPVREDCSTCHVPHGSVHRGLLEMRPPQLCQQCHMEEVFSDHAARMYDGNELGSGYASGRGCLNCHSQVHGSDHPQGYDLRR